MTDVCGSPGVLTEHDLRRQPVVVSLPDGARTAVIPDGWIDLRVESRHQIAIALELDRGTTDQRRWRRKVAALLAWADGPYQARFATRSLTIAVVATPGTERQEALRRWTEAELRRLRRTDEADLFRFAGLTPAEISPVALFRESRWRRPFAPDYGPLIPALREDDR